jgi:hypothetical protein
VSTWSWEKGEGSAAQRTAELPRRVAVVADQDDAFEREVGFLGGSDGDLEVGWLCDETLRA